MSAVILSCIAVLAGLVIVWGLRHQHRFLTFPVLAAFVYAGWLMPQAVVIANHASLPADGIVITMTMALLAMLAIIAGWRPRRSAARRARTASYAYAEDRMLVGVMILSLAGAYCSIKLWSLPDELLRMTQWSGPQTIWIYFTKLQWMALALAWLLWLRNRRQIFLIVVLFNFAFLAEPVFLGARRALMAELGLILLGGLWFQRRWKPSRTVLLAGAIAAVLVVNSIGAIRSVLVPIMYGGEPPPISGVVDSLLGIDYVNSVTDRKKIGAHDLSNAVYITAAVNRQLSFNFGTDYWNVLVNNIIPAQWFGKDFKSSLMFDRHIDWETLFHTRAQIGSTETGFSDAFKSFWFFGVFVFFGISSFLRCLFDLAEHGELWAQYAYILLIVDALHAITHHTGGFIGNLPLLMVISFPLFLLAKVGRRPKSPTATVASPSGHGLRSSASCREHFATSHDL